MILPAAPLLSILLTPVDFRRGGMAPGGYCDLVTRAWVTPALLIRRLYLR